MRGAITYTGESIVRSVGGYPKARKPRVASEKSDIEYLLGVVRSLCTEITGMLGPPGVGGHNPLRRAVYAARAAEYRVVHNKAERDARAKAKR